MSKGRILWVDDEVDLLRPHTLLLIREGYHVDAVMNGADALELLERETYDLILLDEQMPGLRGLDVLSAIRTAGRDLPIVMVTKSEAEETLHEALGRRADDYVIKPTSPRQVLSVVTRLLAGARLRHQQAAREFTTRFGELREAIDAADSWEDWAALYSELVDWDLRLEEAGETSLADTVEALRGDVRRNYSELVAERYSEWLREEGELGPPLSVDIVERFFAPLLGDGRSALLIVIDCLRLDQWRAIRPLLTDLFEVEEALYSSLLPTATPFSRNAIFSGLFADDIEESRPGWYDSGSDAGYNTFEDELFATHVEELVGGVLRRPGHSDAAAPGRLPFRIVRHGAGVRFRGSPDARTERVAADLGSGEGRVRAALAHLFVVRAIGRLQRHQGGGKEGCAGVAHDGPRVCAL